MSQSKFRMPSTQGGIVRYSDEEHDTRIKIKPEYVIGFIIALGIVVIALQLL